jgi:hypothetical protein
VVGQQCHHNNLSCIACPVADNELALHNQDCRHRGKHDKVDRMRTPEQKRLTQQADPMDGECENDQALEARLFAQQFEQGAPWGYITRHVPFFRDSASHILNGI